MKKGIVILSLVFLVLLFGVMNVLAQSASFVNHQIRPGIGSVYGSEASTYWPILDNPNQCEDRQDILLNLAPLGCEPAVVRSDLLAEQNVPVFCQIDAMNINPLLDIEGIRNIRFTGDYPVEVAGVGYHPAQAALRSRDRLLGDPGITNMGYVVVVLKQQPNETAMPDFVEVNLSAQLEYASGNAFGVGRSEFRLNEQSLDEFEDERARQSFWNGRFSLRLVEAEAERAAIEVWDGDFVHTTLNVRRGEKQTVYVPGSYCGAALGVEYTGFEADQKRAKVEIADDSGSDVLWVYEGSRFLNDKCSVRNIEVNENEEAGEIEVSCGGESVDLSIGSRADGEALVDEALNDEVERSFNDAISAYEQVAEDFPRERASLSSGSEVYGEEALVRAIELAENTDGKEATQARLMNRFIETYPDSSRAGIYQIELNELRELDKSSAGEVVLVDNRYRTIRVLDFEGGPGDDPVVGFTTNANPDGTFDAKLRDIISDFDESSDLNQIRVENILSEDEVEVRVWCEAGDERDDDRTIIMNLNSRISNVCPGADLTVERISDFDSVASIRIVPEARHTESEASLSVKVGIEKRAIELAPEKINEKLENLNKSVERWNELSDNLGNVVEGMKTACFATSAALIAKNFIAGTDGTALARQQAMNGIDGWKAKCQDEVAQGAYVSMSACFNENKDEIEGEVQKRAEAISSTEDLINGVSGSTGETVSVYDDEFNSELIDDIRNEYGDEANGYLDSEAEEYLSHSELRELAYNLELQRQGVDVSSKLESINDRIELNREFYDDKITAQEQGRLIPVIANENQRQSVRAQFYDVESSGENVKINGKNVEGATLSAGMSAVLVKGVAVTGVGDNADADSGSYLVVGESIGGELGEPSAVYRYEDENGDIVLSEVNVDPDNFMADNGILSFREHPANFNNEISPSDRFVRYFGTGPDSGSAAVVPFNVNQGWYARVVSVSTEIAAYDSSGMPKTWEICNVGGDGRIDVGDECQIIFAQTAGGVPVLGLGDSESRRLIDESRRALLDANSQKGNKVIRIGQNVFDQGPLYSHYSSAQCQDFMSISDCQLLFNVCDPVICPSSRCDLGGEYPVADVIQTGVVGSSVLCLNNFIGFGGDVAVPVCLSGIKSGIDGYVSILESHQQCLQESLETGQQIGICDQISAVYTCDFFWRQITPVAKEVLPSLVSGSYNGFGRASRGGGEYGSVQAAFENTDDSINYFTQSYAANSFEAFSARNIEEAGTEFCKAFISLNVPTDFETLVAPDSPPQYHAWFSSQTFSDVTVPATAQYKVFYHIFAGEDRGAAFSVYLKDPPQGGVFAVPSRIDVVSGYVGRGDFATESLDFTAPEGYSQLCVLINGEEECGFKQVSSSFALNYLRDSVVSDQLSQTDIKSTEECIAGTTNPAALLNPNIQAGAEEALSPEVYNRGIVRICSSRNPGEGTEPTRFQEVGVCDEGLTCYLDKTSVEKAITNNNQGVQDETLEELEQNQKELLIERREIFGSEESSGKLVEWENQIGSLEAELKNNRIGVRDSSESLAENIGDEISKFYLNYQKAAALSLRAQALELVYRALQPVINGNENAELDNSASDGSDDVDGDGGTDGNVNVSDEDEGDGEPTSEGYLDNPILLSNGVVKERFLVSEPVTIKIERDVGNCPNVRVALLKDGVGFVGSDEVLESDETNWSLGTLSAGTYSARIACFDVNTLNTFGETKRLGFEVFAEFDSS